MQTKNKITSSHLRREAVIYIRQSSAYQVQHNKESQQRQYDLQKNALRLGWMKDQITLIDEDLGISGAHIENRPGYQKLISLVALRKVGIILGIEVSRLTRNCRDWYELLEISSTFDTLIADEETIFNPSDYNDRLLLGLKGTISEAELHQIKCRMMRGRLNKAKRGDLAINLPIGYEWHDEGKIVKSADESIRTIIDTIFSLFQKLGSVRGVLLELKRRNQALPHCKRIAGLGKSIDWRRASYDAIYLILTNVTYAGVYAYGRRKREYDPVKKNYSVKTVASSEWEVFITDHHDGYITYNCYQQNMKTLLDNQYNNAMSTGAAREGCALLQGIVYCKRCGLKMRPRYTSKRYYYCCDRNHRRFGDPVCGWASANRVDDGVVDMLLQVINEGTVDLSFEMMKSYEKEQAIIIKQHEQKIKRLTYEANVARRRYESVDPENRLVASTLEKEWNEKLEQLNQVKIEIDGLSISKDQPVLSLPDVKQLLAALKEEWLLNRMENQDKKQILRFLIERVFIDTQGKILNIEIVWHGHTLTKLAIPKYLFSSSHIYHRIKTLANEKTDSEIADQLNQEGLYTVTNKPWTPRRVMDFRLSNQIPSGFTFNEKLKIDTGYITSKEAAEALGVKLGTIQRWFKWGILEGRQGSGRQSKLWIMLSEEDLKRLDGTAAFTGTIKSFRSLMKSQKYAHHYDLVQWAKTQGHKILRLKRGKHFRFYIQPVTSFQ